MRPEELTVLGRWFMTECGGVSPAVTRLSRRLQKLGGAEWIEPLMEVIKAVATASETGLSPTQAEALDDIKRAFRIR